MPKGIKGFQKGNVPLHPFPKGHKLGFGKKPMLGKKHSFETKKKISLSNKGKKRTLETKKNISLSLKGRIYKKECKGRVFERDNFTCQRCGISDKEVLVIDHITPKAVRPDLRKEFSNMVTLCANCHMKKSRQERRDKVYGKKKKEDLI